MRSICAAQPQPLGIRALRIALGLEYEGSGFCGWQSQPGGCAVQDALERALAQVAGKTIETVCAGRTDAGVHALAQVVHFDVDLERAPSAWIRGGNALLPDSVAVNWARRVSPDFHARFSATGRRYVYWLLNRAQRPGLLRGRVGWFYRRLDERAMLQGAQCLVGSHDFSAFRAAECQAKSPVRRVDSLTVTRRDTWVVLEITANAFLHHMVRNVAGLLMSVGHGESPPERVAAMLAARDRRINAVTAPPDGLYLAAVRYPEEFRLPGLAGANDAGKFVQSAIIAGTSPDAV